MTEHRRQKRLTVSILAIVCGVLTSTGLLIIGIVIAAAVQGYEFIEFYGHLFPRFRGDGSPARVPAAVYVIFFGYVAAAAQFAIMIRRRLLR